MLIDKHLEHGIVVLKPEDRLDIIGYLDLEETLADLVLHGLVRVVIDLSLVTFVSSTSLAVILRFTRETEMAGGRLVVASVCDAFRRILAASGVDAAAIPCFDDCELAVDALKNHRRTDSRNAASV